MTLRVIIESPYAGDVERNQRYLRRALLDSLYRGEAPFAGHGLYTQVLEDTVPVQRKLGLEAADAWIRCAELCAVYDDLGVSRGMERGIALADRLGIPVKRRQLGADWEGR